MQRLQDTGVFVLLIAAHCGVISPATVHAQSNVEQRTINGETFQSERDEQEALYNYYFREQALQYETNLDKLKSKASVPSWRIPYSAAIHPESAGGLTAAGSVQRRGLFGRVRTVRYRGGGSSALSVYDQAFNDGQDLANSYELRRIMGPGRAVFGVRRMRNNSEAWEGYCSGFTASTIRHPEPVNSVDAGDFGGQPGVILQPAQIKVLLTAIYNRTTDDSFLFLAPPSGSNGGPNMGTFHLTLANYIGQAGCPVGIDRTKGRVAWNNPIYAYEVKSIGAPVRRDGVRSRDVETKITYSFYGSDADRQTDRETGARVGNRRQSMMLRYTLMLDDEDNIVGGRAKSASGHFLWIPLYAVQASEDGSVPGNPYIDVAKVIAMARASALPEVQSQYDDVTIGPEMDPSLVVLGEQAN